MSRRPRLLFVVNDGPFFVSHRLPLAVGALRAGFEVHVATPRDAATTEIEASGCVHHPIGVTRRGMSPRTEATAIAELIALYRRVRPDLVHHVTAKAILYGGIAARIARVPCVVHAVSGLGYVFIATDARARAIRQMMRLAYGVVTGHAHCAVIFQNDDDRRVFGSAIRTPHVHLIAGAGVDLDTFVPSALPSDEPPVVLLPSRMLRDKGVLEFVGAARRLRGLARFVLAGGTDAGNPTSISEAQLRAWVDQGIVEWWGHRRDMPDVLAKATLVCLPSYREGMPKALLEALAIGRPIVTTDVPGCRDIVSGSECGVLVPARDAAALADALRSLLGDRVRVEQMARAAAVHAREFSVDRVVRRTIAIYRSLLATAHASVEDGHATSIPPPRPSDPASSTSAMRT